MTRADRAEWDASSQPPMKPLLPFEFPQRAAKPAAREWDWTLLAFWTTYLGAYAIGAIEVISYCRWTL